MTYAAKTEVSTERTKADIERLVVKHGATGFVSGWMDGRASIQFRMNDRLIRFVMILPRKDEERFTYARVNASAQLQRRSQDGIHKIWDQACRSRWRALMLVIQAKLEAVEADILTFEESFLAEIVMPDTGKTVWETVREPIKLSYENHPVPLLPGVEHGRNP